MKCVGSIGPIDCLWRDRILDPTCTIGEASQIIAKQIQQQHQTSFLQATTEAKQMVQQVLGLSPLEWACSLKVTEWPRKKLAEQVQIKLLTHQPISRLSGMRFFWKHDFMLNKCTLDPRIESEGIITTVLRKKSIRNILDLGTGSGCLLISLLAEYNEAVGTGVDVEINALNIAKENAKRIGVSNRSKWVQSHWFSNVNEVFDCIVSNPPYVATSDYLGPEVRLWDPPLALDGGVDGLECYKSFIPSLADYLAPNGIIVLEIGETQGVSVKALLAKAGFYFIEIIKDLFGRDRYILASFSDLLFREL